MILYINTAAQSPGAPFTAGVTDTRPVAAPDFVVGDVLDITIYLVDGKGNYDARSGTGATSLKVALGTLNFGQVAFQGTWTPIANGFRAEFNINTDEAHGLVGVNDRVVAVFEVEMTDADSRIQTCVQCPVWLKQELIPVIPSIPTPSEIYTPTSDLDKWFVQNRFSITSLTGGTATDLDGIPTVPMATGTMVAIVLGGSVSFYRLTASTAAESSPSVIRPDDFDNPDNARVWMLVSTFAIVPSDMPAVFDTLADAKAIAAADLTDKKTIYLRGLNAKYDGGYRLYVYDASSTATADDNQVVLLDNAAGRLHLLFG